MRRRATAAAVSGALALTALAIPVAQADAGRTDDAAAAARTAQQSSVQQAASAKPKATSFGLRSATDEQYGDTTISDVVVNGGKDVVLGTTNTKTVTVTFTATDDSGIEWADAILWHGGATFDELDTGVNPDQENADCTATSSTTAKCTQTFTIDPQYHLFNAAAGTWKVWAIAQGNDADWVEQDNVKTFSMKRYSKLTANASPEPVLKGRTITISGLLTRANWDTYKYAGYTQQSVKLQSRAASGGSYATLKTYTSGSGSTAGQVKTTRTASTDTCWRYSFAGTSTTPAVTSSGDCVDVR
ncbi:DUF5707 domain-containing protein [Streptomyces sp. NPDC050315]|uniref:DUF5707 domain-containing protein n=1 Tax=Streptomyces sp. NPDC050315 TaxID=3155039 RepID=UPI00343C5CDE